MPLLMLRILRAYNIHISFPPHALHNPHTNQPRQFSTQRACMQLCPHTMHPSHNFFTLLLTFMPLASSSTAFCLKLSGPGLFSSLPRRPAPVLHVVCSDAVCVLRTRTPLAPVLSGRAVCDAHVGKEVNDEGNREVEWRCGRAEKLRRAVIAAFARGWSMACLLGLRLRQNVFRSIFWKGLAVSAWIRVHCCIKSLEICIAKSSALALAALAVRPSILDALFSTSSSLLSQ